MSYSKYFSIDEEYYMILCKSNGPSLPVHHILCEHFILSTHYTFNKPSHCFVMDVPTHTTHLQTESLLGTVQSFVASAFIFMKNL